MTTDARLQLRRRLEEVLGADAALVLMDHLPDSDWSDVVRRGDLERGNAVLSSQLRTEMEALGTQLRTEMEALGTQLRTEMEVMRHELIALFRSELHAAFSAQTRTIVLANIGLLGTSVALSVSLARALIP